MISKWFRNLVNDTRVYRSADIGSDHYFISTAIKLRFMKRPPKEKRGHRIRNDTLKLQDQEVLKKFNIILQNHYQALGEEIRNSKVDQDFEVMQKAYMETAGAVFKNLRRRETAQSKVHREAKRRIKRFKRKWTDNIANEVEDANTDQDKTLNKGDM